MSSRNSMPALDRREERRADQMREHGEIAAPQRAFDRAASRTVERKRDRMLVRPQHGEAMLDGELARRLGAEVVCRHRARVGDHARPRERGKLERGEIGVTHPALAALRKRAEVETVEQPRIAVAATDRHGDVDVVARGHARDCCESDVVIAGEPLMADATRLVLDDAMSSPPAGGASRARRRLRRR